MVSLTLFQCDEGAGPTKGFSLSCNGTLSHDDGDTTFYSCPTGQRNGWNIYSKPLKGEPHCVPIWLRADSCYSGCVTTTTTTAECPKTSSDCSKPTMHSKWHKQEKPEEPSKPCTTSSSSKCEKPTTSSKCASKSKSPPPPPPAKTSSCEKKMPHKPTETCPALLTGNDWEFPHLIVPISKSQPKKAFGTVFNGTASHDISSVFQFDIPKSAAGKTCNLQFYLPKQHQLETSAFELKSEGKFRFQTAYPAASTSTTYSDAPKPAYDFGVFDLKPGNAYQIGAHQCPAGQAATFVMSAVGQSYINYFQDYNPCPIGLYMTIS